MSNTIKQFNKQNLKEVRVEIDKTLNELGKKLGIKLSIRNIRFDDLTFRTTLEANIPNNAKLFVNPDLNVKAGGGGGGVLPTIGLKFFAGSRQYEIIEYKLNRPKFPIIAKRLPDGKRFKFTIDQVNNSLKVI